MYAPIAYNGMDLGLQVEIPSSRWIILFLLNKNTSFFVFLSWYNCCARCFYVQVHCSTFWVFFLNMVYQAWVSCSFFWEVFVRHKCIKSSLNNGLLNVDLFFISYCWCLLSITGYTQLLSGMIMTFQAQFSITLFRISFWLSRGIYCDMIDLISESIYDWNVMWNR